MGTHVYYTEINAAIEHRSTDEHSYAVQIVDNAVIAIRQMLLSQDFWQLSSAEKTFRNKNSLTVSLIRGPKSAFQTGKAPAQEIRIIILFIYESEVKELALKIWNVFAGMSLWTHVRTNHSNFYVNVTTWNEISALELDAQSIIARY